MLTKTRALTPKSPSRILIPSANFSRQRPTPMRSPTLDTPQSTESRISVDLRGSFSVLPSGSVTVLRQGTVVAEGSAHDEIRVSGTALVDVNVVALGLVDTPSVEVRGVALRPDGRLTTVLAEVRTGLVRAQATLDGRRISGVVWLYRIDDAGGVQSQPCGSFGANGSSREISAGRYRAILRSGGVVLSRDVTIVEGGSRLVRLEG
jgi:hypothetical protein